MIVGRLLLSFWDGIFSGAMLDFQGVVFFVVGPLEKTPHEEYTWNKEQSTESSIPTAGNAHGLWSQASLAIGLCFQ